MVVEEVTVAGVKVDMSEIGDKLKLDNFTEKALEFKRNKQRIRQDMSECGDCSDVGSCIAGTLIGCGLCLLILIVLLSGASGIVMLVLGGLCLSDGDYAICGGTHGGAVALVTVGAILVFCCCLGGGAGNRYRNSD